LPLLKFQPSYFYAGQPIVIQYTILLTVVNDYTLLTFVQSLNAMLEHLQNTLTIYCHGLSNSSSIRSIIPRFEAIYNICVCWKRW